MNKSTIALTIGTVSGVILYAVLLHQAYTWRGNTHPDFYVEWVAARVALRGGNPYSEETTRAIQLGSKGRLLEEGEDQLAFANPFYRLIFNFPLAFIPYDWATAIWQAILQTALVVGVLLFLRAINWQASPWDLTWALLATLLAYPVFGGLMLGQVAVGVLSLLLIAYWSVERNHDGIAGCCLAGATVKPQLAVLAVPYLLLWGATRRRWRIGWAFALSMGLLMAISLALLPTWPIEFMRGLLRYPGYKPVHTGPGFLFAEAASPLWPRLLEIAAVAWLGIGWWAALRPAQGERNHWREGAFVLTLAMTTFVLPQTSPVDRLLLLPAVLLLMRDAPGKAARTVIALLWIGGSWLAYSLLYTTQYGLHMALPPLIVLLALGLWYRLEVKRNGQKRKETI